MAKNGEFAMHVETTSAKFVSKSSEVPDGGESPAGGTAHRLRHWYGTKLVADTPTCTRRKRRYGTPT